jgi:hypothetical protein
MSLVLESRSASKARIWLQTTVAFAAVFTLLVARVNPPRFPKAPSSHSSLSVAPDPGERLHFDSDGSQWSAPAQMCLLLPPAAESERFILPAPLSSFLQTRGLHYNRPPPIV